MIGCFGRVGDGQAINSNSCSLAEKDVCGRIHTWTLLAWVDWGVDGVRGDGWIGNGRPCVPTARQAKRAGPYVEAGPEASAI